MSHVPRVYAFGHGKTSSRTPLIILVFGEICASVDRTTEAIVPMNEGWRRLNANMSQYVPLCANMGQYCSSSAVQRKTVFVEEA